MSPVSCQRSGERPRDSTAWRHSRVSGQHIEGGTPMRKMYRVLTVGLFSIALLAPSSALAEGPPTGGGAGCKANGQAVASAAQAPGPFGQFVSTKTPIADDVAH